MTHDPNDGFEAVRRSADPLEDVEIDVLAPHPAPRGDAGAKDPKPTQANAAIRDSREWLNSPEKIRKMNNEDQNPQDNVLARQPETHPMRCPVQPLGHRDGTYFFISPNGELRGFKAEALEAGRSVFALFAGADNEAAKWAAKKFPKDGGFCPRRAGKWIIGECNQQGRFDPESADMRGVGTWRQDGIAIYHSGGNLHKADGTEITVPVQERETLWIVGELAAFPGEIGPTRDELKLLFTLIKNGWGWAHPIHHDVVLGWVAAALLGGFPNWRTHIFINGLRGSGKSTLLEIVDLLLGDLAGGVLNDVTEVGLRQFRDNQARPLLTDEFERCSNDRENQKQEATFGLFRRMSGGYGGRTLRGSADHKAASFRTLGPVMLSAINGIEMPPQDRTRFVDINLKPLPETLEAAQMGLNLAQLRKHCEYLHPLMMRRMLDQSPRWDETHAAFAAAFRKFGADQRQADTAATIATGSDLLIHDGAITALRVKKATPLLTVLLGSANDAAADSEGAGCLDHLLSTVVPLDHGVRRSIKELVHAALDAEPLAEVQNPEDILNRFSIFLRKDQGCFAIRIGTNPQLKQIFQNTR